MRMTRSQSRAHFMSGRRRRGAVVSPQPIAGSLHSQQGGKAARRPDENVLQDAPKVSHRSSPLRINRDPTQRAA